ncbi:MAG: phosphoribosylformylglycinamidine synthase subunit PurQ [Flavobacteriaceae bacterium]
MKSAIILFPGLNRERDMATALRRASGRVPAMVWHTEREIPAADVIVVPGGFSYGDYLRCGAIAARSPIMADLVKKAAAGVTVLGVCNGFQILTEAGLLPGALMRNAGLKFVCRDVRLRVERNDTRFTSRYAKGEVFRTPVAHGDGNYFADAETLARIEGEGQVLLRYADGTNCNGSMNDIAGVLNRAGNVLGMMPHPENMIDPLQGGTDGFRLFQSLFSGDTEKAA